MFFFMLTMYFSGGLIPTYLVVNNLHLTNTFWAMIIPGAISIYNVIITRTYFINSIPKSLEEAAELDGANKWQRFRYITMPFLLPVLSVVLILQIKNGLTVYDIIVALTNGGPGGATESLSILIYNHGFKEVKFSYAIAEAIILTIVICAISFVQTSISNKKKVY